VFAGAGGGDSAVTAARNKVETQEGVADALALYGTNDSGTAFGVLPWRGVIRGYHPSQARGFNPRPWICEPSGFKKALNPRLFFLVETDALGL